MKTHSPIAITPITEFAMLLNPNNNQYKPNSQCARIERRLAECFEAYGMDTRGKEKCKDLIFDYHECRTATFQRLRVRAIRQERMRQYREGKIDKPFEEHVPIDGMIYY